MLKNLLGRLFRGLDPSARAPAPADDAAQLRAHSLFDAGQFEAAQREYDALARSQPSAAVLVNRGYCELMLGQAARAAASFREALDLEAGSVQACIGLGDVAARRGEHLLAMEHYDRAIALEPDHALARNNRAQSLHALGRLRDAWSDAEYRWRAPQPERLYPHHIPLRRWEGELISRGRLLVHWEQGFGDIIQHMRFLPMLSDRAIPWSFECPPPLAGPASRLLGDGDIVQANDGIPDIRRFRCCIGLASLPHVLGLDWASLPRKPYLTAPAARRLPAARTGIKPLAALCWRSSRFDPDRDVTLGELLTLKDARWDAVSLQRDVQAGELPLLAHHGIASRGADIADFDDSAALLEECDLLVSVDTALAHLAGAMGKPVLLLLNEPCAARWMQTRADSPWYPTMRLVRKPTGTAWLDHMPAVRAMMDEMLRRT
jgi:hypothetical protein